MLKKKCSSCAKKIERKFNYCPYCGLSFKASKNEQDYGFLGKDEEEMESLPPIQGLPFGMNKLVNTLVKQLEKELSQFDNGEMNKMPKGFKINISTGKPMMRQLPKNQENYSKNKISPEEMNRRLSLPKSNAESKVKRLSDKIIYEIETPGVKEKDEVTITKLATGLEVRAYSNDKCYIKFIPLTVEIMSYNVKDEKIYLELKI